MFADVYSLSHANLKSTIANSVDLIGFYVGNETGVLYTSG